LAVRVLGAPARHRGGLDLLLRLCAEEGEGYDSPRVKAEAGPVAMMMLHNAMEQNYGSLIGEFESSMPPNPALDQIVREYRNV
jgi:hypothetical protein